MSRGERERLAVEVPGRHHLAVGHHDRVVHHRAQLDVDDPAGVRQHVPDRAVHLRRAAQAVRVLHRVPAVPVAGQQRRAGQQRAQVGRAVQLARVRPDHLHPLVVGPVGAEQRLDGQRAGQVGRLDQHQRVVDGEGEQRLHRLGPVDQGQALLRGQLQRLDAVLGQHLGAGPARPAGRRGRAAAPRRSAAGPGGRAGPGPRTRRPSPCPGPPGAGPGRAVRAGGAAGPRGPRSTPAASVRARSSSSARTVASSRGAPVAAACERMMAPCSRVRSCSPTRVSASAPNPVLTP